MTGLRHFTCNNYCLKFLMYLSDFLASFSEDESKIKKELDDVKAYYKVQPSILLFSVLMCPKLMFSVCHSLSSHNV